MKKLCFITALLLCFSLCSCGIFVDTDTTQSAELSQKYSFYKNSVSSIRGGCNVSPEEADGIFLVLVNDCGVDKEISVTPYVNAPYSVKYGTKTLSMTLNGGAVSEVFDGENRLYPVAPTDESSPAESNLPEESEPPADGAPEVSHRSGEEIVGVSDKDISDLNKKIVVISVPNDVTENWKYITLSESTDFLEYALSYYNLYFANNKEIHAVINFTNKTTTKISVFGDKLEITVHDYVDGEEHDATIMFSGTPLASYIIYTDNGDIEKTE